jgi:hypothetical protein
VALIALSVPISGNSATRRAEPEALRAFQKAEIKKWWPIIKAADIKAE